MKVILADSIYDMLHNELKELNLELKALSEEETVMTNAEKFHTTLGDDIVGKIRHDILEVKEKKIQILYQIVLLNKLIIKVSEMPLQEIYCKN